MKPWPLLLIVGPTASGKSELALRLAARFRGEIVNCDSVQVFKHFDIGTAKPTPAERLDIPHHLLDFLEPDALFTAGEYMAAGRKTLADIRDRGNLPVVVGGTGLYLRALLEGLFKGPQRCEPLRTRFNSRADRKGIPHLHRLLTRVDPVSAGKIAANDRPKLIRALEVFFLTARPLSSQFLEGKEELQGFLQIKLGLNPPRPQLYEAIHQRVDRMFQQGLVSEVQTILHQYGPSIKPLQSLGYAQVLQYLQGKISLEEAMEFTRRATRHYAKRQLTWFRREKEVCWHQGFGHEPHIAELAARQIGQRSEGEREESD